MLYLHRHAGNHEEDSLDDEQDIVDGMVDEAELEEGRSDVEAAEHLKKTDGEQDDSDDHGNLAHRIGLEYLMDRVDDEHEASDGKDEREQLQGEELQLEEFRSDAGLEEEGE